MKKPVVCDSTCLIGLERIGALYILPALFEPVMIPPEVAREFGSSVTWLHVENLVSSAVVAALRLVVDSGEAEAITLANEQGCLLISDDKHARRRNNWAFVSLAQSAFWCKPNRMESSQS